MTCNFRVGCGSVFSYVRCVDPINTFLGPTVLVVFSFTDVNNLEQKLLSGWFFRGFVNQLASNPPILLSRVSTGYLSESNT